jgi:hypothetical protein
MTTSVYEISPVDGKYFIGKSVIVVLDNVHHEGVIELMWTPKWAYVHVCDHKLDTRTWQQTTVLNSWN